MKIGALRSRVIVQRPEEAQGLSGEIQITWRTVATVWASIGGAQKVTPIPSLLAHEHFRASMVVADLDVVVRMRWAPIIRDIDATWRLIQPGGKVLNILGIINVEEKNEQLELSCNFGKHDGR